MRQDSATKRVTKEGVRQAQWVREHPQIDESGFPEYPDEPSRRGSSRGAVPNGNPWRPVDPDERPGRIESDHEGERISLTPDSESAPTQRDPKAHPWGEPPHHPAVVVAGNDADERLGYDIDNVLATAKVLEGAHLVVEVVDGDVYLYGTVADQSVKNEVGRLASSVHGAKIIRNELDVRN